MNETLSIINNVSWINGSQLAYFQQNCTVLESQVVDSLGKIPKLAFWITAFVILAWVVGLFVPKRWQWYPQATYTLSFAALWVDLIMLIPLSFHLTEQGVNIMEGVFILILSGSLVAWVIKQRKKKIEVE